MDDATQFGVKDSDVAKLASMLRGPVEILDGSKLAKDMPKQANGNQSFVPVGTGGALTYCLLRKEGFETDYTYVEPKRVYEYGMGKRPSINVVMQERDERASFLSETDGTITLLDDVIASGMTLNACMDWIGRKNRFDSMSLVLSMDIRPGDRWRAKEGSTINGITTAYASQTVKGVSGRPAILSLRFILLKCRDEGNASYLMKYVDEDSRSTIMDFIRSVDIGYLGLLYKDPVGFIKCMG